MIHHRFTVAHSSYGREPRINPGRLGAAAVGFAVAVFRVLARLFVA
jgi:hypothetical protein